MPPAPSGEREINAIAEVTDISGGVATDALAGSTDEPKDAALVARVRDGDEAAFEELFNRHRRRVALIAGRFFRQREQIEEIVQESFTKAYFALDSFSGEQEMSFAAWLARITFNTCYDELRRLKRRPESTVSDLSADEAEWLEKNLRADETGGSVESVVVSRDLAEKLLARLTPEDQLVLMMLDVEEMSVSEIAKLTQWSASKVKVRAHRARVSLRRVLSKFL
ncbi:MAG: sigma-70 family RNA polymerase sigma factor [Pyrinomonadaceae bacterium]|nr:sigma-70 family RNA polymerase sigma factor [Pyrinomonadaceae bacterium]